MLADNTPAQYPLKALNTDNMDSSLIWVSESTLNALNFFKGDTVLIKTENNTETIAIILTDNDMTDSEVKMNRIIRENLCISETAMVTLEAFSAEYLLSIEVATYASTAIGISKEDIAISIKSHFQDSYRAIKRGDVFCYSNRIESG